MTSQSRRDGRLARRSAAVSRSVADVRWIGQDVGAPRRRVGAALRSVCPRYLQPDGTEAEGNGRSGGMKPDGEAAINPMVEDERTAHRRRPPKCRGTCRRRKPHHRYSTTAERPSSADWRSQFGLIELLGVSNRLGHSLAKDWPAAASSTWGRSAATAIITCVRCWSRARAAACSGPRPWRRKAPQPNRCGSRTWPAGCRSARCWWPSPTSTRGSCGRCWHAAKTTTPRPSYGTRWCNGRRARNAGSRTLPWPEQQQQQQQPRQRLHRQSEGCSKRSDRPEESLTNTLAPAHAAADPQGMGETGEWERPSGAVFTMVRIGSIDPTRPVTEMQSGNACAVRSIWSCSAAKCSSIQ